MVDGGEMKRLLTRIPAALLLSGLFVTTALAQTSAAEIAANLRVQLSEVQGTKEELKLVSNSKRI